MQEGVDTWGEATMFFNQNSLPESELFYLPVIVLIRIKLSFQGDHKDLV